MLQLGEFETRVTRGTGTTTVAITGEIDLYTGPKLWECLEAVIADSEGDLVLDCSDVSFLDSTGISVIVRANRKVGEIGRGFRMGPMSEPVRRVLEITGVLPVLATEEATAGG